MSLLVIALVVLVTPFASDDTSQQTDPVPTEEIVIATVSENPPARPRDLEPQVPPEPETGPEPTAPPTSAPPITAAPATAAPISSTASPTTEVQTVSSSTAAPLVLVQADPAEVLPTEPPQALALAVDDQNWSRWYAGFAALIAAAMIGLTFVSKRPANNDDDAGPVAQ